MLDFLRILIQFFDKNNIPYMLSGSMAMSTYTVPRFTKDFVFIVPLKPNDLCFCQHLLKMDIIVMRTLYVMPLSIKGCSTS